MESEALVNTVMALVSLLLIAGVSAVVLKRLRFPFTVGLVILGVALAFLGDSVPAIGGPLESLELGPDLILFVFIPLLIFESAFNTKVRSLFKDLVPALTLAAPGLLLSTALIGLLVGWLTPLPYGSAFLLGCLISATDPVAVIALFKDVGAPERLSILVEGESLFNDATAIVTFQIILGVIATGVLTAGTVFSGIGSFFVVFIGGLIVGLGMGYILSQMIPVIGDEPLVHITLTLVVAFGSFIIAEHFLHTSGVMAVLGAGLVLGHYGESLYPPRVKEYLEVIWEDASFISNGLIFLLLGLSEKKFLTNVGSNPQGLLIPALIVIGVVLLVRAVIIFGLTPLVNRIPTVKYINRAYQIVMYWGGLRGAVAIALAISLPTTFPFRWQIIDFAFAVVLFTLLVNGTTMRWLMQKLGMDKPALLEEFSETFVEVMAKREAVARLKDDLALQPAKDHILEKVRQEYQEELDKSERHLISLRNHICQIPEARRALLWLRALAVQDQVYHERFEDDLLSLGALRDLEWELREVEQSIRTDGMSEERIPVPEILQTDAIPQPMFAFLPNARVKAIVQTYEQISTLYAAARIVLTRLDRLRDFAEADNELLGQVHDYYQEVEDKAMQKMSALEHSFTDAFDMVQARQLNKFARDGEQDVMRQLHLHDGLPEILAERLEDALSRS